LLDNEFTFANAKAMIGKHVKQVKENELPYIVSISKLVHNKFGSELHHVCTATLISNQDVITVGHCINSERLEDIQVIVGSIYLRNGKNFCPLWWITYNQWIKETNVNEQQLLTDDVAIIRVIAYLKIMKFSFIYFHSYLLLFNHYVGP
jgi:V8-like Glu-specific endopeptidase